MQYEHKTSHVNSINPARERGERERVREERGRERGREREGEREREREREERERFALVSTTVQLNEENQ